MLRCLYLLFVDDLRKTCHIGIEGTSKSLQIFCQALRHVIIGKSYVVNNKHTLATLKTLILQKLDINRFEDSQVYLARLPHSFW